MKVRFIPLIVALVAGLSLVASSAAAPPASSSVQLQSKASFVTTPSDVLVRVTVVCPFGTTEQVQARISQPQPPIGNTNGFGVTNVLCDGTGQTVSVLVSGGPFTLGSAFAAVRGINFNLVEVVEDERVITIS
jgi:hypothetical protein